MTGPEQPVESTNEKEYVWPQVDPANAALVAEVLAGWLRNERPGQENLPPEVVAEVLHLWARASSNAAAVLADHAASIRDFRAGWDISPGRPEDGASP